MKSFFQDGLSIDETRVSVLVITYLLSFAAAVTMCIVLKDTDGLKTIFYTNLGAVTGASVMKTYSSKPNALPPKAPDAIDPPVEAKG